MVGCYYMAQKKISYRPRVPLPIKLALYRDAGQKCANPGCPNTMLELHHINEWHIYQTHSQADMIAVCPTCHGQAHRGQLVIDDETIRRWKGIHRSASVRGHIYVEPGDISRVLLGCVYVTNGLTLDSGMTVFALSERNQLRFRVVDGDIMLLNLTVTDAAGHELVRVVDGHLKHGAKEPVQ